MRKNNEMKYDIRSIIFKNYEYDNTFYFLYKKKQQK